MVATTPFNPAQGIYADEFSQGRPYSNYRPNGSGDFLLIYTIAGNGEIATDSGKQFLSTGDVLLYEPGAYQNYSTAAHTGRWELAWAHFQTQSGWQDWFNWPLIAPATRLVALPDKTSRTDVLKQFRLAAKWSQMEEPFSQELALNAFEAMLILISKARSLTNTLRDERVQRALDMIARAIRNPLRVEDVALHCGLSESRLAHLFKSDMKVSLARFIEQERLRRAARLLDLTRLSIGEIATECGYENGFHFSNRFKVHYQHSPSSYRNRASKPRATDLSP